MKKLIFVIVVLALIMGFTNPSQREYNSWVNDKLADKLNYNSKGSLGKAIAPLTGLVADSVTDRHNYIIFSIYETNIADTHITKTLGIFKMFFEL